MKSVAVLSCLLLVLVAVKASQDQIIKQVKDLLEKRRNLALLRKLVEDMDDNLLTLHKRACLGLPGAGDLCDANDAVGSNLDSGYLGSSDSPGKRNLDSDYFNSYMSPGKRGCSISNPGACDGYDADNAWNTAQDSNYIGSHDSPGKRSSFLVKLKSRPKP